MTSCFSLDEQINALNALHSGSAKALDNFADTSKAIVERARRIAADVQQWEVAQENIASTIEEMSRAARCYHPPPALRLVLSKREKNPDMVCKSIDYLVFTDSYLASHPPNVYADQIASNISTQLENVVKIAEDIVKEAFINALQKKQQTEVYSREREETDAAPLALLHNPKALDGIDRVVHRLGENFDRTEVVSVDVKELLSVNISRLIDSQFDSSYKEEEMYRQQRIASQHGMAPLRKHYQKGAHRLLGICAKSRSLIMEISVCLKKYVLDPLDDSFDVIEIPSELAALVFERIKDRCLSAIEMDRTAFSDPTHMFVMSRGEGIGLWGESRHFRDIMFIGLDLLEELWKWKVLAEGVAGDNHNFVDYVDSEVERFLFEVRDLLDCYVTCKGALDVNLLKTHSRNLHRTEWFPSLDCSAHVSVTNQVYLHKVLLMNYYGAVKLALHGALVNPSAEAEALQELEDYIMRCVLGTLQDLEVIAKAALELQLGSEDKDSHIPRFTSHQQSTNHLISPPIFMLNSIGFLSDSYCKEPCFQQRRLHLDEPIDKRKTQKQVSSIPIVANVLSMLEDEKGRYIDEFAMSWSNCFPSIRSNSALESIASSGDLRKSQRLAVKHWYRDVATLLTKKFSTCRTYTVLDMSQRSSLIQASVLVVRQEFEMFEVLLNGRTWSSRPLKWMLRDVEQWTDLLHKCF